MVAPRSRSSEESTPRDERDGYLAFSCVSGIGPRRLEKLIRTAGDVLAAWHAPDEMVREAIGPKALDGLRGARRSLDLEAVRAALERCEARVIIQSDPEYPQLLTHISSAPFALFVRGDPRWMATPAVAVVGTRRATKYGRRITARLATELARAGVTVVSGLARGIDSIAHRAAIEAGGGTVAVLGCGIERCYPIGNTFLATRMLADDAGALVSEYPPGVPPLAFHFPARNRIISGLCVATIVVEAGTKSGASITARKAADQGRDVFAVPGRIDDPTSVGTNRLLADGAGVVTGVEDVLEALDITRASAQAEVRSMWPADETEAQVLELLGGEPKPIDELARELGRGADEIGRVLAMLELKGMARRSGGTRWQLAGSGCATEVP